MHKKTDNLSRLPFHDFPPGTPGFTYWSERLGKEYIWSHRFGWVLSSKDTGNPRDAIKLP